MRTVYAAEVPLGDVTNPGLKPGVGTEETGLEDLISRFIGAATIVAGLALVTLFIFGAIKWSTASGDKAQLDEAKKTITNAVIGLVLVVTAMIFVSIIQKILGVDLISPTWTDIFVQ